MNSMGGSVKKEMTCLNYLKDKEHYLHLVTSKSRRIPARLT